MRDSITDQQLSTRLRREAEVRLRDGTPPLSRSWAVSADALGVLYRLASNPDSAAEGLKLLHELQTHQVELDLQQEQLQANEIESSHYLSCYKALYEMSPVGCFILGLEGMITECNVAGARLFGAPEDLCGRGIQTFVVPESKPMLAAALANIRSGGTERALIVTSELGGAGPRQLRISMNLSADREAIVMIASEYDRPPGG